MRPIRFALLALAAGLMLLPAVTFAGAAPPGLNGPFFFVAKDPTFEKHQTLTNIDQLSGEFCLAGQIKHVDTTTTLNRRVDIDYSALGSIEKATDNTVEGDFGSVAVTVTLTILELLPLADGGPTPIFGPSTITPPCELRGSLLKGGFADRASLACEVGLNFSDFGVLSADQLATIAAATKNKKGLKINVPKGTISAKEAGVPMPPDFVPTLVCDVSED